MFPHRFTKRLCSQTLNFFHPDRMFYLGILVFISVVRIANDYDDCSWISIHKFRKLSEFSFLFFKMDCWGLFFFFLLLVMTFNIIPPNAWSIKELINWTSLTLQILLFNRQCQGNENTSHRPGENTYKIHIWWKTLPKIYRKLFFFF